jgi:hypothetical protein
MLASGTDRKTIRCVVCCCVAPSTADGKSHDGSFERSSTVICRLSLELCLPGVLVMVACAGDVGVSRRSRPFRYGRWISLPRAWAATARCQVGFWLTGNIPQVDVEILVMVPDRAPSQPWSHNPSCRHCIPTVKRTLLSSSSPSRT